MSCLRTPDGQFTLENSSAHTHMLCHGTLCHVIIPLYRDRATTNNLDLSSQLINRRGGGWREDNEPENLAMTLGVEICWLEKDGRKEGLGHWYCHTSTEHPTGYIRHESHLSRRTGVDITKPGRWHCKYSSMTPFIPSSDHLCYKILTQANQALFMH